MAELLVTFAAGASYGMTTAVVGQPLDTIKVCVEINPFIYQRMVPSSEGATFGPENKWE